MQLTIKVEAGEIAQAINNLSTAVGQILAARAETRAEVRQEKVVAPAKSKAPAPAAQTIEEPAAPVDVVELALTAPSVMTYSVDVASTMGQLLTEKGAGVVKELLAEFGVKKGAELAPDQLALALARAKEILNG